MMTNRYEGVFLELLRCGTVAEMLETLEAHIEQVDQGMLAALIEDDRFDEFYVDLLVGVLAAKRDRES
jgi:hypothetical protein